MINIKQKLADKLQKQIGCLSATEISSAFSEPPKADMGDIAFPCYVLSKKLKLPPAKIAIQLSDEFEPDSLFIKAVPAGPFLNIFIDGSQIASSIINYILDEGICYGSWNLGKGKKVVIDYSSPNIAKHLGVHHLRSTMIGNAICNLHEKCGYEAVRVNYLGDWGTQFGKLIAAYKLWHKDEILSVDYLAELYVKFNKEAENNLELEDAGRSWFKKLEEGDAEAVALWKKFRSISLQEFMNIYDRLGLSFTCFDGESNYSQGALNVVAECLEKGIAKTSQGAVVVSMGDENPPCLLQKSDGATTYLARDIAAVITRHKEYGFHKMLYVVGQAQALHFDQVFYVIKQMGYNFSDSCKHIPFGLLKFQGSKCSSRQGNLLLLTEVLDVAADEVKNIATAKGNALDPTTIDSIGMGAVIFADLSTKRTRDVNFNWDEILNFDGNTGPYLQYTLARCGSICNKSAIDTSNNMKLYDETSFSIGIQRLTCSEEKLLLLKLLEFRDVIKLATEECDPSILGQFIIKLSRLTNKYIHNVRVIQDDKQLQVARAALLQCIIYVIEQTLKIFGIQPLERM